MTTRDEINLDELADDELECISDYMHTHENFDMAAEALGVLYRRSMLGESSPPLIHNVPPKIGAVLEFLGLWHQKRGGGGG